MIGNNNINRNTNRYINKKNNNILFNARVNNNNTFKAKDSANFSTTSVDRNKNKNKNKNIDIESYKLLIDDKFRSEELVSLFNFLD